MCTPSRGAGGELFPLAEPPIIQNKMKQGCRDGEIRLVSPLNVTLSLAVRFRTRRLRLKLSIKRATQHEGCACNINFTTTNEIETHLCVFCLSDSASPQHPDERTVGFKQGQYIPAYWYFYQQVPRYDWDLSGDDRYCQVINPHLSTLIDQRSVEELTLLILSR